MQGYRLGAIAIVITFFTIITATVLLPMVLFNPKASGHGNSYVSVTNTISGVPTPGDVLNLTIANAGLKGDSATVSVPVKDGQTVADLAAAEAEAINGNDVLQAIGIAAKADGNVVTVRSSTPTSISPSLTGSTTLAQLVAGNDIADPARGRRIYVREGCFYCHTQFTRLQDRGYGPLVKAGDYDFETPHQLGTARTGPDLTNEGGRFPSQWQKAHLINPRAVKPGSIMPSFSFLNDRDMNDLVAYIQTLGNQRKVEAYVQAPDEYKPILARKTVDTNSDAAANAGRGIYTQNCAACHGLEGEGNGPNSIALEKKPANFTRPFFKQYPDDFWFYRISEGVSGTRMPHFGETLTEEQRWYLVAYLKTLQQDKEVTIDSLDQINKAEQIKLPVLTQQRWEPASGGN